MTQTATPKPISRYPVPSLAEVPDDLRARMLEVQEKAGFVPNVFLTLAHRPDECRAFFAYHDALMLRESGLTKGEKEMIVVATSGANDCLYCVVAHGAILRVYEKQALVADQIAVNYRKADITPRQKAMLAFAMKVATDSAAITEADFEAVRAHGFSDEDIWDIGGIAAFFALSNRMANMIAMRPNDEFYLLGRVPREKEKTRRESYTSRDGRKSSPEGWRKGSQQPRSSRVPKRRQQQQRGADHERGHSKTEADDAELLQQSAECIQDVKQRGNHQRSAIDRQRNHGDGPVEDEHCDCLEDAGVAGGDSEELEYRSDDQWCRQQMQPECDVGFASLAFRVGAIPPHREQEDQNTGKQRDCIDPGFCFRHCFKQRKEGNCHERCDAGGDRDGHFEALPVKPGRRAGQNCGSDCLARRRSTGKEDGRENGTDKHQHQKNRRERHPPLAREKFRQSPGDNCRRDAAKPPFCAAEYPRHRRQQQRAGDHHEHIVEAGDQSKLFLIYRRCGTHRRDV